MLQKWHLEESQRNFPTSDVQHAYLQGEGKGTDSAIADVVNFLEQTSQRDQHCIFIKFDVDGAFNKTQYYQYEKNQISPAGKKQIIMREVLDLKMNDDGIITEVEQINLDQSEDITPAYGKTKTAGSDFTMLQQIFSN